MSDILQRLETDLPRLLPPGKKVLVAVSGGVDSMVLLNVLHRLAPQNRWKLRVAHFNHQLRGRASDADEKLVRRVAMALKLRVFVGNADVKSFAIRNKISVEMAARQLRHEFLARTARSAKTDLIALAHHADDQVELFFLRLFRGAGGEGLGGMKRRATSFVDRRITLVRPLLALTKTELVENANANRIAFREDASNQANDFLRNRIRNELLPLLKAKYSPSITGAALRLMDITGAEADFVSEAARSWRAKGLGRNTDEFASQPLALQRKILQAQLVATGHPVEFELVEQLREATDTFISLNPKTTVARDKSGTLKFKESTKTQFGTDELVIRLRGRAGQGKFVGRVIRWRIRLQKKFVLPVRKAGHELFDADQVGGQIILRHWQAGDRFQPIGLKSATKLQDLFVNAKIPATRRHQLIIAATQEGVIFWVEGLRIGEQFKLTPKTRRQLVWQG